MYLLTAKFVKNSYIQATIYFISLKNTLKQTWNPCNTKFHPQQKHQKSSYQVRRTLALFCNLICLISGHNSIKALRVTKIVKEIKFEEVWGKLKSKKGFQIQSFTKYLRLTLVFLEIVHYGKSLTSVFQECFDSINGIFILKWRLSTRLLFYEV